MLREDTEHPLSCHVFALIRIGQGAALSQEQATSLRKRNEESDPPRCEKSTKLRTAPCDVCKISTLDFTGDGTSLNIAR